MLGGLLQSFCVAVLLCLARPKTVIVHHQDRSESACELHDRGAGYKKRIIEGHEHKFVEHHTALLYAENFH